MAEPVVVRWLVAYYQTSSEWSLMKWVSSPQAMQIIEPTNIIIPAM